MAVRRARVASGRSASAAQLRTIYPRFSPSSPTGHTARRSCLRLAPWSVEASVVSRDSAVSAWAPHRVGRLFLLAPIERMLHDQAIAAATAQAERADVGDTARPVGARHAPVTDRRSSGPNCPTSRQG